MKHEKHEFLELVENSNASFSGSNNVVFCSGTILMSDKHNLKMRKNILHDNAKQLGKIESEHVFHKSENRSSTRIPAEIRLTVYRQRQVIRGRFELVGNFWGRRRLRFLFPKSENLKSV